MPAFASNFLHIQQLAIRTIEGYKWYPLSGMSSSLIPCERLRELKSLMLDFAQSHYILEYGCSIHSFFPSIESICLKGSAARGLNPHML
jgi:hypothetical protein